jgi:hypothetical protein
MFVAGSGAEKSGSITLAAGGVADSGQLGDISLYSGSGNVDVIGHSTLALSGCQFIASFDDSVSFSSGSSTNSSFAVEASKIQLSSGNVKLSESAVNIASGCS